MSNSEKEKQLAGTSALTFIEENMIIGVGTGSTVKYFIEGLAKIKSKIEATIASSEASAKLLKEFGLPILDLNTVDKVDIYVDGTDSFDEHKRLIKGAGGALTREKILAHVACKFICITDKSKRHDLLGNNNAVPVPIEVIPMARSVVGRELFAMGASPQYRENYLTDNGNIILDTYGLDLLKPLELEHKLNTIPGVVENGIFAYNLPEVIIIGNDNKAEIIK